MNSLHNAASSWMNKIRGIFNKKASPQEIGVFASAVKKGNAKMAMKIWPKISSEGQNKAFSYYVANDKHEMLRAMLQKIPSLTVFKEIQSHMDPRYQKDPKTTLWLLKNIPSNMLTPRQWCELTLFAAFRQCPDILNELYTARSDIVTPYVSSQSDCQSTMDQLRPLLSAIYAQTLWSTVRFFDFTLSASACLGNKDYLSRLLPLARNYDLYHTHEMMVNHATSVPVTPEVLECFIALLPKDEKLVDKLFSGCLSANVKEYLDVIFDRYPTHKFTMHDFYVGIRHDNQEQFDLVFNRVDWVQEAAREVMAKCVQYDRQYMFECLLPKAASSKTDLSLALMWAARNNNVAMVQKMLSPQWLPYVNPHGSKSAALQVACAYGSVDVFDLLYPHSDPKKALKSLRKQIKSQTQHLPHNIDLLVNYDTHAALSRIVRQTQADAPATRPRRM